MNPSYFDLLEAFKLLYMVTILALQERRDAYVPSDQHGHFIMAESVFLGHVDSFTAEIMGILMWLRKCAYIGLWNVRVQTDNTTLAQRVKGSHGGITTSCVKFIKSWTYIHMRWSIFTVKWMPSQISRRNKSLGISIEYNGASMLPRAARGLLRLDSISYPYLREKKGQ